MNHKARLTRITTILVAAFFVSVLGSTAPLALLNGGEESLALAMGPEITILPDKVPYERRVQVFITGSGFKPKQELGLRIMMGGVLSDVSYLVKPQPVTNANGSFATVWSLDREIRGKLLEMGALDMTVVDEDGNELTKGKLNFVAAKKKSKKGKKNDSKKKKN
jgi:hypothetical protein